MKIRIGLISLLLWVVTEVAYSQAKRPTLMVVPSDVWCNANGYMRGDAYPDYKKALQSSMDLHFVIAKINSLMAERGFSLQSLEETMKAVLADEEMNDVIQSKETGAGLTETSLDRLYRQAKADLILELTWNVNRVGPKKSITFNLQALDAYTHTQVAGTAGTGAPSFSAELPVLLEEAVLTHLDVFTDRLQEHFNDLQENGRLVSLEVRVFDDGNGIDFEKEFEDIELSEVIDNWMYAHTVSHRFNKLSSTGTMLRYNLVRIPLFRENGMPLTTEYFARDLMKMLRKEPYKLTCKVLSRGLGQAILIIGGK